MLAEALRLRPPLVLRVQTAQLPLAVALSLEPESNGDWEAVRREAGQLEQQILAQLLVVGKEQRLPLWVNGTQNIWLRVTDVSPVAPAVLLGSGTELQVHAAAARHGCRL